MKVICGTILSVMLACSPASALEMPEQLIGTWCQKDTRIKGVDHHFDKDSLNRDECGQKKGYFYTISKNEFAACKPLSISKIKVIKNREEWTIKAKCPGDGSNTFLMTQKFVLIDGIILQRHW